MQMQKTVGESSMSIACNFYFHQLYKEGLERVEGEAHPGRLSTSTDEQQNFLCFDDWKQVGF